jgi:hypothetical protein
MVGSSISALVSISCAAVLDQFSLVVGTEVHCDSKQFKPLCSLAFLGLLAPVHAQKVQIRRAAHRVLTAALLLLEQYHNIMLIVQKESCSSD